jgi:hypothetical protein
MIGIFIEHHFCNCTKTSILLNKTMKININILITIHVLSFFIVFNSLSRHENFEKRINKEKYLKGKSV